jgi:hypothetical protein
VTVIRSALLSAALVVASACASQRVSPEYEYAPKRDRSVLTEEEILATRATDAFRAVRSARPAWLLPKNAGSRRMTPEVYIDGARSGGVNTLSQYNAGIIHEIRYLTADEATTRYGTGHGGGAILVSLKR